MVMNRRQSKIPKGCIVFALSSLALSTAFPIAGKLIQGDASKIKNVDNPKYINDVGFTTADPRNFLYYVGKPKENIIPNVTDYSAQYFIQLGQKTTCAAVACINIIDYWGRRYKNLVPKDILVLHNQIIANLNTKSINDQIGSNKETINLAIKKYANNQGLDAEVKYYDSKYFKSAKGKETQWLIIQEELQAKRPLLGSIHTFGSLVENHEVTIIGSMEFNVLNKDGTTKKERYLVINDGSDTTKGTTYTKFSENSISIITFKI